MPFQYLKYGSSCITVTGAYSDLLFCLHSVIVIKSQLAYFKKGLTLIKRKKSEGKLPLNADNKYLMALPCVYKNLTFLYQCFISSFIVLIPFFFLSRYLLH